MKVGNEEKEVNAEKVKDKIIIQPHSMWIYMMKRVD